MPANSVTSLADVREHHREVYRFWWGCITDWCGEPLALELTCARFVLEPKTVKHIISTNHLQHAPATSI